MTWRLGSISDSNQHIIPVSIDRNADQLEPTRFENYSLADAADKKRRDLIYSQQLSPKSCVLSDNSFAFLRELVASVPDVQGEEEQGTSMSDGNSENQHARLRRPKDRGTSEDSAGPSHSTADESETWSAEEDGEEDSETSSAESSSHQQPTVSSVPSASIPPSHCNVAFQTSSSHNYMSYPVPYVPNNNTSNSVDDDYDS
ncbi:hypothetical protein AVEN_83109-1 [Araneus ventricosus]|uniref:Uncharacterized protein n=1 Tax=Araneus ventricosus TaxID=182803 RepID=A0A4Y2AP56_ARAVE|nr:hypothetical protein AVEN_83109-1 [Araneus ventricosus]